MLNRLYKTKYDFFYFLRSPEESIITISNFAFENLSKDSYDIHKNIRFFNNSKDIIVLCIEEKENVFLNVGVTFVFKDICKILLNGEVGWVDKDSLHVV
jgi:hypothetical protein